MTDRNESAPGGNRGRIEDEQQRAGNMLDNSMPENIGNGKGGARGSHNISDDDRDRWDANTKFLREHDYDDADGRYAYTEQKGINSDGKGCWRTGRKNMMPFDERFSPEEKREWFPGKGDQPWVLYKCHIPEGSMAAS